MRARRGGSEVAATIATVVAVVFAVIALIIALGIVFTIFDANQANGIVKFVLKTAKKLVGPFDGLFVVKGNPHREILVNWGIAAVIYLIIGGLISRLFRRAG
jgi:hypothetical protein